MESCTLVSREAFVLIVAACLKSLTLQIMILMIKGRIKCTYCLFTLQVSYLSSIKESLSLFSLSFVTCGKMIKNGANIHKNTIRLFLDPNNLDSHLVSFTFDALVDGRRKRENPVDGAIVFVGREGLKWYAKRLKIDEDGDVADELLDEVLPETSSAASTENEKKNPFPKFEVTYSTRPAKVKTQVMSHDGKIQPCMEYQRRLQWV
ncbi:hypothetical protein PTKIN_Ptkin05aG0107000 [Pterospermum kingtungense]